MTDKAHGPTPQRPGAYTPDHVRTWAGRAVALTLASVPDHDIPEQTLPTVTLRLSEPHPNQVEVDQVLSRGPENPPHQAWLETVNLTEILAIAPTPQPPQRPGDTSTDLVELHGRTVHLVRKGDPQAFPVPSPHRLYRRHVLTVPYEGSPEVDLHEITRTYTTPHGTASEIARVDTVATSDIALLLLAR
ncbi:hypothetical protein [Nocardiopsis nanhaiensis]